MGAECNNSRSNSSPHSLRCAWVDDCRWRLGSGHCREIGHGERHELALHRCRFARRSAVARKFGASDLQISQIEFSGSFCVVCQVSRYISSGEQLWWRGSTSLAAGKARRSSHSLRRVVGQPRPTCGAVAALAVLLLGPALPLAAAGVHPCQSFSASCLSRVILCRGVDDCAGSLRPEDQTAGGV